MQSADDDQKDDLTRPQEQDNVHSDSRFPEISPLCMKGSDVCHCCLQALDPGNCDCPALKLVALNVRRLRLNSDLSQQELSARANIHRTHLARFETQATNISLSVFFKIARGLDVDPRELLKP